MRGKIVVGAVVVMAALQVVPVDRSNPPVESAVIAPAHVQNVMRRACYDCHSHETVWPWYSRVAPVSFLIAHDVKSGRAELNFSTWDRLAFQQQAKKAKKSWEEVAEGEMPPRAYVAMHPEAALSGEDRTAFRAWAAGWGGSLDED